MADRVHLGPFLDLGFWLWALVGVGLGFATSFVLGIFTVPASVLVALILLTRPRLRTSAFGTFVGFGAVFLLIAYLQRRGPGVTCWHSANASGCDEWLDPRPYLLIGLASIATGLLGHAWR